MRELKKKLPSVIVMSKLNDETGEYDLGDIQHLKNLYDYFESVRRDSLRRSSPDFTEVMKSNSKEVLADFEVIEEKSETKLLIGEKRNVR